MLTHLERIVN